MIDVRIDIDKKFDKDLKKLTSVEKSMIEKKINLIIDLIRAEQSTSQHLSKIHKFHFGADMDSSLYVLRVNKDLRIILTSEEDPLFNEHILTLLRVVRHDDLDKTFKGIGESLFQSFLNRGGQENG
jgi:mRNA-degrading endonuclease YafQ of YafQ-DinJ toxin-antitoxin module